MSNFLLRFRTLSSLVLFIYLTISFSINSYCQGFLKASGKNIVNGTGQIFLLKGIGLGGWLVPEGYMLHTAEFANSPTAIRNKIEALIGTEKTNAYYKEYESNYVNEKDINKIAEWGFNSIRLPMHYNKLTPKDQPGIYLEEGFKQIDSLLSWCKQNSIYLILDLHCAPGAQNKDNISDSDGEARLWTEPANQTRTVELWKKLAERYANEEWIGGYDLINETAYDLGTNNTPLRNLFVQITNAIRTVDKNHIIFIEGNWYATTFTGLTPPWDDNMAYSFHKYWNTPNQSSIQYLIDIRNTYNIPLWCGETGENSNSWFTTCVELFNENNIGWAWWPHKKIASTSCPLSAPLMPGYQNLINYWKGNTSKPSIDIAYNALITQARNLSIDKCTFHQDVIDALLRAPGNDETKPYIENKIPGFVYAVNYDMGKVGYAYQDKDYTNTSGSSGTVYNSGYEYRNDGVDIENCDDIFSYPYNVGWIETGDWLRYTVKAETSGIYDINLRIAGSSASGKILLKLDNSNLADFVDVPVTGGYQNWQDVKVENVYIPSGEHSLQILFFFGGFNYNYAEFILKTTDVENEISLKLENKLYQNYPNPFNPNTTIKFTVGNEVNESSVKLSIYDILGKEIGILLNEKKQPGEYNIEFDGSNLPSGMYFYELEIGNYRQCNKLLLLK